MLSCSRLSQVKLRAASAIFLMLLPLSSVFMFQPDAAPAYRTREQTGTVLDTMPLPVQYAVSADLARDDPLVDGDDVPGQVLKGIVLGHRCSNRCRWS